MPANPPGVLQRSTWNGIPREVAEWWTLKKGQRHAICRMFTHVFGHELRLEVSGDLISSQVCKTDEEVSCVSGAVADGP